MKRIFGESKGLTVEGWGPEVAHCVPGFPRNKGDAVLGAVVKRQQGQGEPGIFPKRVWAGDLRCSAAKLMGGRSGLV